MQRNSERDNTLKRNEQTRNTTGNSTYTLQKNLQETSLIKVSNPLQDTYIHIDMHRKYSTIYIIFNNQSNFKKDRCNYDRVSNKKSAAA